MSDELEPTELEELEAEPTPGHAAEVLDELSELRHRIARYRSREVAGAIIVAVAFVVLVLFATFLAIRLDEVGDRQSTLVNGLVRLGDDLVELASSQAEDRCEDAYERAYLFAIVEVSRARAGDATVPPGSLQRLDQAEANLKSARELCDNGHGLADPPLSPETTTP